MYLLLRLIRSVESASTRMNLFRRIIGENRGPKDGYVLGLLKRNAQEKDQAQPTPKEETTERTNTKDKGRGRSEFI